MNNIIKTILLIFIFVFVLFVLPKSAAAQSVGKDCEVTISNGFEVQCKPWQKKFVYTDGICTYTLCAATPDCILQPEDHWYYDDPKRLTRQQNEQAVTLPTGLAWSDAPGWNFDEMKKLGDCDGVHNRQTQTSKIFGIHSYIVEIDNTKGQLNEEKSKGGIFTYCTKKNHFNPTDEDLHIPCFFNSDTDIRWRVRPCSGVDCSNCEDENRALWWTFHTSPAPEPLGVVDKNHPITNQDIKNQIYATEDPDWNGPDALTNVDYPTIQLRWCSAVVSKPKLPYNQSQNRCLSYQMRVHSNESQVINLNGSFIPSKFTDYANWLKIDKLGYGPQETCHYLEKQNDGVCKSEVINPTLGVEPRQYFSHYLNPNNDRDLFTKNLTYYWQLRSCFNNTNAGDDSCQTTAFVNYGQKWKFTTASVPPVEPPTNSTPTHDQFAADESAATPIGLPVIISWKAPVGANSYGYQIQEVSGAAYKDVFVGEHKTIHSKIMFSADNQTTEANSDIEPINLNLNTVYRWRARSCWPSLPLKDSYCDSYSPWFYFRTTGRPPKTQTIQPANNADQVSLPVTLQWENVPGAMSYIVEVNGKNTIVAAKAGEQITTYQLNYPTITQKQSYHWRIRTCADANAINCGAESDEFTFTTAALTAPTAGEGQNPQNNSIIQAQDLSSIYNFTWKTVPGAYYYHFVLSYTDISPQETNKDCQTGEKANIITNQNFAQVKNQLEGIYCLGDYMWHVTPCMDPNCSESGPTSDNWTFKLAGDNAPKKNNYGLGVCGLPFDNPDTPYDERQACQPKHFLLLIEQLINFILFKLAFILLPILAVITGVIFYKSLGGPEIWGTIKTWWKYIGVGYGLLFFAWVIVGILLSIFGFTGAWWKL